MYEITKNLRVKDSNEKPTERYERGLEVDSLTIFKLNFCFKNGSTLKMGTPKNILTNF